MRGSIHVNPDFTAGRAREAVNVDVTGGIDAAVNFKAEPQIFVTGILSGGCSILIQYDEVLPSQLTQKLSHTRRGIGPRCCLADSFTLVIDFNVAVVGVLRNTDTAPGSRSARAGTIRIGVLHRQTVQTEPGTDRVIRQSRQNDREIWLTNDLQNAANSIVNIQRLAARCETGICSGKFHDEAGVRCTVQSQTTECVEVWNHHFVQQNVSDVCVVPDSLSCQRFSAHNNAVHSIPAQQIANNQWSLIVAVSGEGLNQPCGASIIALERCCQRVGVNGQHRPGVIAENIVDQNRLSPASENRSRGVGRATVA